MNEHDQELQRLLRLWEAPVPGAALDERVLNSFRKSQPSRSLRWLSIAAGIALLGALGVHLTLMPPPVVRADREVVSVAVIEDAAGFIPMANGNITVTKGTQ